MSASNSPAPASSGLAAWFDDLLFAVIFLTRVPLHAGNAAKNNPLATAMRTFPLAGAMIGCVGGLAFAAAAALGAPHPLSGVIGVAATVLLTGALHEDGFADIADGFGGGYERERKMEIMRDSRVGTYGGAALVLSLLLRATAAGSMGAWDALAAFVAAGALGRGLIPVSMTLNLSARSDGVGASSGYPTEGSTLTSILLGLLIALLALGPGQGFLCFFVAAAGVSGLAALAKRQIGGYTGDVLGAGAQLVDILVMITVAMLRAPV
ncbi:adenosylcobinamide-GDP ribazoletransferase [Oleispirillum naphthae]|uniref:adenosylcobinamide-GDP ribazoletransferase n=1 Tax=Oleispirillum naphthae TaxID=2838853 RepID=UPI0030823446